MCKRVRSRASPCGGEPDSSRNLSFYGVSREMRLQAALGIALGLLAWDSSFAMGTNADASQPPAAAEVVELRDGQSGFAGLSGTVVVIEPDGAFHVARFLNEQIWSPTREGKLGPEDMAKLNAVIGETDFAGLPPVVEATAEINPRVVSVRYGDRRSTWQLTPGQPLSDAISAAADVHGAGRGFLRLVRTIREVTGIRDEPVF